MDNGEVPVIEPRHPIKTPGAGTTRDVSCWSELLFCKRAPTESPASSFSALGQAVFEKGSFLAHQQKDVALPLFALP